MKLFIFLCLATLAFAIPHSEWQIFKAKHNKIYRNRQEEQFRMSVFVENQKIIRDHNKKFENGEVTFKMAMNQFGDLLSHEVKTIMNGFKMGEKKFKNVNVFNKSVETAESFDWRKMGAVTPVKNQGQCGSCWSFSTTGALEGQIFMKTGSLVSLSEQNLMDCSTDYGNYGCGGGLMDQAFAYIQDNHGIDTEESYPYEEKDGKCRFNPANVGGTDKGFTDIPTGDEEALRQAVATIGPIAVAIDASQPSFHLYSSGVYIEPSCTQELDHAVLAVGYGTENGHDYWLIKNSWGATWGEDGYIKMARNRNNHCGIASSASYPIV